MEVGALQADPAGSGEAVEHEVAGAAAQEAGLEPVDLLRHLHRVVAEQPASGLDVDRLPRLERLLEHVAVSVDPDDALVIAGEELVDPEAAAVEHVREALDPAVVVLDAAGGGQELMLAHDDPLTRLEMQRDDVTGRVAAERDLAGRLRLEHQQRHAAEHAALEPLAQRMQADLELRVLPQQHVVLEVHRHLPVERHVQDRDELAFEPVGHSGGCPLRDLGGKDLGGGRHLALSLRGTWTGSREPLPSTSPKDGIAVGGPGRRRDRQPAETPARGALSFARASGDNRTAMAPIYVTGHRNPDADSIAAAIGYAELKRPARHAQLLHRGAPRRVQRADPWLLERSGAPQPLFLPHVMVRAYDVMQDDFPIANEDAPIREAGLAMARAGLELVPVVDGDGALVRRRDRALAGAPLHPRDARDLDPAGRADAGQCDRRRARRQAPRRRGQGAVGARVGAGDGPDPQRRLGRRRGRGRQSHRRPADGDRAGREADRALQRLDARRRDPRAGRGARDRGDRLAARQLRVRPHDHARGAVRRVDGARPADRHHRVPGRRDLRADQGEPLRRRGRDRSPAPARRAS